MLKKLLTTLVLFVCMLLSAASAWGQEADLSPEESERAQRARELFDEGSAALKAGDNEKALQAFESSFNLRASFDTAANLGQVEMMEGMYVLAARHLEYSLRHFPTGENRELKNSVKKLLAEVQPKVVTIHADVSPSGARVTFGEHEVGRAPIRHPLFAKPNTRYRLTVEGPGGESSSIEIIGKAGEVRKVELQLDGGANVDPVSSGLGVEDESESVAEPDSESSSARKGPSLVPAYILGGLTVATVGTSIVMRSLSGSNTKEMDNIAGSLPDDGCAGSGTTPPACQELEETGNRANTQATVADVTLIAGGVLGAATLGYLVYVLTRPKTEPKVQAAFVPRQAGGMLSLSGHF